MLKYTLRYVGLAYHTDHGMTDSSKEIRGNNVPLQQSQLHPVSVPRENPSLSKIKKYSLLSGALRHGYPFFFISVIRP